MLEEFEAATCEEKLTFGSSGADGSKTALNEINETTSSTASSLENDASDLSTDSGSVADDDLVSPGLTTILASSIPEGARLPIFQAITAGKSHTNKAHGAQMSKYADFGESLYYRQYTPASPIKQSNCAASSFESVDFTLSGVSHNECHIDDDDHNKMTSVT